MRDISIAHLTHVLQNNCFAKIITDTQGLLPTNKERHKTITK